MGVCLAYFRSDYLPELNAFLDQWIDCVTRRGDCFAHADRCSIHVHATGFDLRQVEQVVDHGQEIAGRLIDLVQVLAIAVGQLIGSTTDDEVREALDGVHRGAELMSDRGQECGFALGVLLDGFDVEIAGLAQRHR
tara:strand:+ start:611 stop:1018 length:408 start_codon:yes stop_codon:yes gene_type:complete